MKRSDPCNCMARHVLVAPLVLLMLLVHSEAGAQPRVAPPSQEKASAQPFYYYEDERIPLELDPMALTVAGPLASETSARAALATMGVEVRAAQSLQDGDHWLLELAPGHDHATARAAAQRLRADGRFGFAANVYRAVEGRSRVLLLNRVAVRMRNGTSRTDVERLNAELGTRIVREPQASEPDIWWLGYPTGQDLEPLAVAARLHEHPLVQWADPDKVQERRLFATPSDPMYSDQYSLRSGTFRNGVRVDVNAEPAWDLTYGAWAPSAGPLVVAVVDSGVQMAHPDLGGGGAIGYDAVTQTFDAWNCSNCASNPSGNLAHGTAVAGIIKAQHNNGIGVAGLAPAVRLMPIRIFSESGGRLWAVSDCAIGLAINNAWYNGAHVMNNSWGGGAASSCIKGAIDRATTEGRGGRGTVMVFATGNDSARGSGYVHPVAFPANLPNVLAVSALLRNGSVAGYSNGGSQVDVAAFGGASDIVSIDFLGSRGYSSTDYTSTFDGTSAAAPQATSVAAMVMSRNPTWTEAQIRDRIKAGADPWGSVNDVGAGKLNAYRALVGRVSVYISGSSYPSTPGSYTWTANASGGAVGYTYRWLRRDAGATGWYQVSTARTYSTYVSNDEDFTLQVTVTNGPDNHTAVRSVSIYGPSSGSCGLVPLGLREAPCPQEPLP